MRGTRQYRKQGGFIFGHIYGKTKVSVGIVYVGRPHFARYPALLKKRGDWSFTEGVNNTLLHVYIHQPMTKVLPGINAWF